MVKRDSTYCMTFKLILYFVLKFGL